MVGEKRNRVVALDGKAGFVEVEQAFGLSKQRGDKGQNQ
jgi:hypothetical protein